jgi:catechol 2,3-dioxygenase-like lactoylglutathione lyase family enzyme
MPLTLHGLTPLVQVYDMPSSVAFYCGVLGFEIVSKSSPGDDFYWAMLKLGGATLMLNTAYEPNQRPQEPDASRMAAHADTGLYFDCGNADEVYAHLRSAGWAVKEPVTTQYGMRQVYTKDPDGFELCFQHPAPAGPRLAPPDRGNC